MNKKIIFKLSGHERIIIKKGVLISNLKDENPKSLFNAAIDGLESFLLALHTEGVDINQPSFHKAVTVAVDAISNISDW